MASSSSKIILSLIALLGWFALIAQFILFWESRTIPAVEMVTRYFSYFTILTNFLVAVYCTANVVNPSSSLGQFFSKPTVTAATTVYIIVVGIIYNVILRFLWAPEGLQRFVDELLHAIIPFLFLAYWIIFYSRKELKWNAFLPWLIYPFVYCLYILLRGSFSDFYPYPFMDVTKLGYQQVLINSLGVTAVFLGLSVLFINITRIGQKK